MWLVTLRGVGFMGIMNSIIRGYGKEYWEDNKDVILAKADRHGALNTATVLTNSRERRRIRRMKLQVPRIVLSKPELISQVNKIVDQRTVSLEVLASQLGISRRALFRRRKGTVSKKGITKTLQQLKQL